MIGSAIGHDLAQGGFVRDIDGKGSSRRAFGNRRRDAVKILLWDRSGFWLLYKRHERGTFAWPEESDRGRRVEMRSRDFYALLEGLDLASARWRRRMDRMPLDAPA